LKFISFRYSLKTTVTLPEEFFELLEEKDRPDDEMRVCLAAHMVASGELSVGRAAESSGLKRWEFEKWLHTHSIENPRTKEDLDRELSVARRLRNLSE
jgi:predicted HTH domain antitoxin